MTYQNDSLAFASSFNDRRHRCDLKLPRDIISSNKCCAIITLDVKNPFNSIIWGWIKSAVGPSYWTKVLESYLLERTLYGRSAKGVNIGSSPVKRNRFNLKILKCGREWFILTLRSKRWRLFWLPTVGKAIWLVFMLPQSRLSSWGWEGECESNRRTVKCFQKNLRRSSMCYCVNGSDGHLVKCYVVCTRRLTRKDTDNQTAAIRESLWAHR